MNDKKFEKINQKALIKQNNFATFKEILNKFEHDSFTINIMVKADQSIFYKHIFD